MARVRHMWSWVGQVGNFRLTITIEHVGVSEVRTLNAHSSFNYALSY